MSMIQLANMTKRFGKTVAVKNADLEIEKGEFVVFLGPSGCGKTTTLRCIAGLEMPEEGEIYIDGKQVTKRQYLKATETDPTLRKFHKKDNHPRRNDRPGEAFWDPDNPAHE